LFIIKKGQIKNELTHFLEEKNMEHSIRLKLTFTLIGILLGFLIGCVVTFSIMRIPKQSTENPRIMKFGDITISALVPSDANDMYAEELTLTKNDRPFLWASRNSLDEVHNLFLIDGPHNFILSLEASKELGEWKYASYGSFDLKSEQYIDINFDGQFDIKMVLDKDGEILSRHIYYEGVWKQIEISQQHHKAVSGTDIFTFDNAYGWRLDKTSQVEPNQPREK
jgi:hypothetical protein